MATYHITYTDTRFDDLSDQESMFKIKDLFGEGKLHLDTDKRVKMLSAIRIYKGELQQKLGIDFFGWFEDMMSALEIYERDTSGDQGIADKLLLDTLFSLLQARAKQI